MSSPAPFDIDVFCNLVAAPVVVLSYDLIPRTPPAFTDAETDVVVLMMRGLSNTEIAELRGTAINTVTNQIADIFRKMAVNTRVELARKLSHGCANCSLTDCSDCPFKL